MRNELFIDGQWAKPIKGGTFPIINPATEEVVHHGPAGTEEDVELAVKAARRAFDHGPWPKMSGTDRAKYLRAIATGRHLGESQITQGNIDNNHFYLRSFIERFPSDLIGGSNKRELANRMATIHWNGGEPITTDIDGSKKFFRSRGWIGDFFRLSKVAAGDKVVVDELAPYQYRVTHRKVG